MTLKEKIHIALSYSQERSFDAETSTEFIMGSLEEYGLDIQDFKEDSDLFAWIRNLIYISHQLPRNIVSLGIIYILVEAGFSLMGNGWLDNDPETIKLLENLYQMKESGDSDFINQLTETVH